MILNSMTNSYKRFFSENVFLSREIFRPNNVFSLKKSLKTVIAGLSIMFGNKGFFLKRSFRFKFFIHRS